MTGWLLNREIGADDLSAGAARRLSDIATYRQAVTDVLAELTEHTTNPSLARVERVLYGRLTESEFAAVLSATPSGPEAAVDRILRDIRSYRRQSANSA
ncbi:MAG: hypothetical protein J2P27_17450, partial [Actinobacteria bacterium]|nr:hypothetical protein [Actinomycetota bacterium]